MKFPKGVTISNEAKSLIERLLIKEPNKRMELDEILGNEFFHRHKIPRVLSNAFLNSEPTVEFILNFDYNYKRIR